MNDSLMKCVSAIRQDICQYFLYIGLLAVRVDAVVIHLHSIPLYEECLSLMIISNFEIALNFFKS
jgi:hypothetical protein